MDLAAEHSILQHLAPGFEQELFLAAIANVDDTSNKLRLNNFAYSMRELIRVVLERLAPDEEVVNAPWFESNDKEHTNKVTRSQRIKYAIQGWLSDDYVTNTLSIDHQDNDKELRNIIDELSKYTHVTESTFNIEPVKITELALGVLCNVQLFLMNVAEARYQVQRAAIECIDNEMIEEFYYNVQNDIDILATHHEILAYMVTGINLKNQDNDTITLEVIGNVQVRLQWGSDGDMRRDDGYETLMSFPFSSTLIASYKNQQGDVHIVSRTIDINTDQFYQLCRNMKIGILTQPLQANYGGLLQNYALQQVLLRAGHEVETIDWTPSNKSLRSRLYRTKWNILSFLFPKKFPELRYQPTDKERNVIQQHTNHFISTYIHHTKTIMFKDGFSHQAKAGKYDAYVVGSDQCWRPRYNTFLSSMFLDFAKEEKTKRIAYAASFGTDQWEFTQEMTSICAPLAQKFDFVSVREDSGVKLCKDHLGVDAVHVLDPTLLLTKEDYIRLIEAEKEPIAKGTLFNYILDPDAAKSAFINKHYCPV